MNKEELNLLRLQNLRNESHYDTCDEMLALLSKLKKLAIILMAAIGLSLTVNFIALSLHINKIEELVEESYGSN